MKGKIMIGTTAETDLASKITLPKNKPKDAPQKEIKKNINAWIKN